MTMTEGITERSHPFTDLDIFACAQRHRWQFVARIDLDQRDI